MISLYFSEDSSSSSVLILTLKPADVEQLMEETNNKQLVVDVNYQLSSRRESLFLCFQSVRSVKG